MSLRRVVRTLGLLLVVVLSGAAPGVAGGGRPSPLPPDPVAAAAGDIAEPSGHQQATGDLVRSLAPAAVLPLGDDAYEDGTLAEFQTYYSASSLVSSASNWPVRSRRSGAGGARSAASVERAHDVSAG